MNNSSTESSAEKKKRLLIQFIKYGISGSVATAVHLTVFYVMAIWVLPALTAEDPIFRFFGMTPPETAVDTIGRAKAAAWDNGIGFVISNFVAYILNILFVFKPGRHHWLVEIGLFYLVSGVSWFVGTSLQSILIAKFGVETTFAFGSNMLCSLAINYAMRKFVIFKS